MLEVPMTKALQYLIAVLFICLTIFLGYDVEQEEFWKLMAGYLPFFLLYVFVYKSFEDTVAFPSRALVLKGMQPAPLEEDKSPLSKVSGLPHPSPKGSANMNRDKRGFFNKVFFSRYFQSPLYFFLLVSILLRIILVFAFPGLSDDIYRFVWDGRLLLNGVNPFDQLPADYIAGAARIPGLDEALYAQLNSPKYFTIYPPVCQAIFASACWFFPQSIYGTAIFMKIIFLFFEIGSILLLLKLLRHFRLPEKRALLYALNPLIILELVGNLHFEAAMVFFLLLSIWLLVKTRWQWSAIAMALSIASKLLPLLFLPFLIKRLGWKKSFFYFSIVGVAVVLMFLPLINGVFLSHFGDSLNLYFQKFEFNASVYYVTRWIGFQIVGYNLIQKLGPVLALLSAAGIFAMAFSEGGVGFPRSGSKRNTAFQLLGYNSLPTAMLMAISWYLFLTTTIHPWYLTLPIVCCVFGRFRYPIVWSGLIMLTYVNYSYGDYWEHLGVVRLEYFVVIIVLLLEWKGLRRENQAMREEDWTRIQS